MVELVQLSPGMARALGGARVLPAADLDALVTAARVLEDGRRETAALVTAARGEAEAIRAAAREAGLAAATAQIQDRLVAIAAGSVAAVALNEQRIVDMGLHIAERVIGTIDARDAATSIARKSLKFAGQSALIRLRVAPGVVEALRDRLDAILPAAMLRSAVEVLGDARVGDAGCILETDAGLIDATIESQLAAIERGLRQRLAEPRDAGA